MKKYRINTTISQDHHAILKKHVEDFGTQQRVLEHALDTLEKKLLPDVVLTPEDKVWLRIGQEIKDLQMFLQKDFIRLLFETADIEKISEYFDKERPTEFSLEWYYSKPLQECTLQEIIDALILKIRIQGGIDTVNCKEEENWYNINMTHNMGINCSRIMVIMHENLFKNYGVKCDSIFSERSVFHRVFKN